MAYSGVFVFGDSLVDAGNALKLALWYDGLPLTDLPEGAPTAELGYYQGRFSNGFTYADLLSNKAIGLVTKPVFPYHFNDPVFGLPIDPFASDPSGHNLNFAYGGAQIRQGDEVVPDFDGQTDAFKDAVDNHADPNALYIFTMGGNDIRNLAPSGSDPVSLAAAHDALDKAADKMLHELEQLIDIGVHNIMITGAPDVGLIPKYDLNDNGLLDGAEVQRSAAATEYSQYLDLLIRTQVVPALQAAGASVTYVPLMDYTAADGTVVDGALSAILPTLAAVHGLTAAELSDNLLAHRELVFFDEVHPTAQVHALVAAYSNARLSGTPWIENLPLAVADVDYKITATIGAAGEVDALSVSLVAGTTYRFDMLGVSSLGTASSLADPMLRLLGSNGTVIAADDDSGAGLDSSLTCTAAS
ncbi:MAG TPA: SGNH/GDSL hydrolase family protein, partial [Sphingomicrobium sp.]